MGYIATGVIHLAIFVLLWFITIGMSDPPMGGTGGGLGISISLGEADMGGLSEIPVQDPVAPQEPSPKQPVEETPVVTDETDSEPDAVVTQPKERPKKEEPKKTPEKKPEVKKTVEPPKEKPRVVDPRSQMKRTTTASGGYGSGDEPGNQGAENGSPDGAPDGTGSGTGGGGGGTGKGYGTGVGDEIDGGGGKGIKFDLKGRTLQRKPVIEDKSGETGRQVIAIVVDRNGKVIKAMPNQRGSTNPKLAELARQAALEIRFSPKPDAPDEQYGSVTIEFKFKP